MRINSITTDSTTTASQTQATESNLQSQQFRDLLAQQLQQRDGHLKLSGHFRERIEQREVALTDQTMGRIQQAVESARAKGAKQSLIMVDELAVIASIKDSTLVTVLPADESGGRVFTNIDSAVIA